MPNDDRLRGLYAIADTAVLAPERFDTAVSAALGGGARVVQYRDKTREFDRRAAQVAAMVAACRGHGAVAIVNDDIELAIASGADGIHVGRDDTDPGTVRDLLGAGAILGVSCYDDLGRALDAAALGADYVGFGSVFASATKPDAVRAPLELLGRAQREMELPICAIGGITAENAGDAFAAGADMVAVCRGLFAHEDIGEAARRIAACAPR